LSLNFKFAAIVFTSEGVNGGYRFGIYPTSRFVAQSSSPSPSEAAGAVD